MPLTEAQLYALVEKRCAAPRWATFPAVRNATGFARRARTADAIAMALWPSMGLELHGFEIKSARHDWLRELKSPEKADEIAKHCDRWWIVANEGAVHASELPPTWGLLEPSSGKLKVVVAAEKRETKDLPRAFFASLMRSAHKGVEERLSEMIHRDQIEEAQQEAIDRAINAARLGADARETVAQRRLAEIERSLQEFEAASGVKINEWNGRRIGDAVALLERLGGIEHAGSRARVVADQFREHATRIEDAGTALERLWGKGQK